MLYQAIFEVSIVVIFIIALRSSIINNTDQILLNGFLYGLTLELLTIITTDRYQYGTFYLMVEDVPIAIALSWSLIIYSAYSLFGNTDISRTRRGVLAGIFALHVDIIMDVIAIRINFWDWGNLTDDYFGVPYGNFLAWFLIVFTYIYFYDLLSTEFDFNRYLVALITFSISLTIILANNLVMLYFRRNIEILFFVYLLTYALGAVFILLKIDRLADLSPTYTLSTSLTISFFHAFFTIILILERIYISIPIIIPIHISVLLIGGYLDLLRNRQVDLHHYLTPVLIIFYFAVISLVNLI